MARRQGGHRLGRDERDIAVQDQDVGGGAGQWFGLAESVARAQAAALVAALEGAFDIMFDTDDILGLSSVARAREILAKYGVVFDAA